ncbi:hypothetical protein BU52_04340 [Streptomyces toyocaensis]|uniref:Uncharacterized protein n=1 Tax=Streptomyces toyocaensis TaxID=55952 RepID=A0A081XXI4_STRTO|nr:hypothetical protein BU52_04340 [Streptomyces toyocaensis]
MTWPGARPPDLSDRERDHLTAACDRPAVRLERAAEQSLPPDDLTDALVRPGVDASGRPDGIAVLLIRAASAEG